MTEPAISHSDLAAFADEKVNLKREDATKYREQVALLRGELDRFIEDHPDYGLLKTLLSGSLAKGTALKTLNDIDVAAYVEAETAPEDETELLEWLAQRIRDAKPQMEASQIVPVTHVVRISYRGKGLDVDLVPIIYEGDPEDRGYLVDRKTGERCLTSIPLHLDFIRRRKDGKRHLAQVARLLKWWVLQRKHEDADFRFRSFLIELVCCHLVDEGMDFTRYDDAMESFFGYVVRSGLEETIAFSDHYGTSSINVDVDDPIQIIDPVNPENNVGRGYSAVDRNRIVTAAMEALERIAEARYAPKTRSTECWREVLGPSFGR